MSDRLEEILSPDLAARVNELGDDLQPLSPGLLAETERELIAAGATPHQIGRSHLSGAPIRALLIESPSSHLHSESKRTMTLWGYPHPDEPLGASWLPALARQHLRGDLAELNDWRIVIVLCADPDVAAMQSWMGDLTLRSYASGAFRPTHLSLEADYGFPIDWGPFLQDVSWRGRCRTIRECWLDPDCETSSPEGPWRCSRSKLPAAVLQNSLALSEALRRWPPDLVISLHNTHTGGDYTFLLERESEETLKQLQKIPEIVGRGRHLGEPIDRGARWFRDQPDLLKEKLLSRKENRLKKLPGYSPDHRYAGNASAANFIEALPGRVQFCCPESTLFYHPDFSNNSTVDETITVRREIKPGRKRSSEMYLYESVPHGGGWLITRQERLPGRKRARSAEEVETRLSRAICGVLALDRRRKTLGEADEIWDELQSSEEAGSGALSHHLYLDERARMKISSEMIGDGAALIFRTRPDYALPLTVAQRASFEWLWPAHTASLLANFSSYLRAQPDGIGAVETAREKLHALIEREISDLPPELKRAHPVGSAARSIAARVFLLALTIERRSKIS